MTINMDEINRMKRVAMARCRDRINQEKKNPERKPVEEDRSIASSLKKNRGL